MSPQPVPPRRFLFLQGLPSRFFARLGYALLARGHSVRRINFNMGDRLFWRLPGACDYRQEPSRWPDFLRERLRRWEITDIVLFGDCRPLHREAVGLAEGMGVRVHVAEEGYLRPNWITLESGGVNGHSFLSRDPDWYLAAAASTPPWTGGVPVMQRFFDRARQDVTYNVVAWLFAWAYPGFRTHRPLHPFREYLSWLGKLASKDRVERQAQAAFEAIKADGRAFYLFPLQLDSDYQLREHSSFAGSAPVIAAVLESFARRAPSDTLLLVKEHPLDSGLVDWSARVRAEAERLGLAERVVYANGGILELMLERARGVVTVNSTVGFLALHYGVPVIALGDAVYGLPRLTFQDGLDDFWTAGQAPDAGVFDAFRRVVAARTQLNGGFFSPRGVELAVAGAVTRLEAPGEPLSHVRVRAASRRRTPPGRRASAEPGLGRA